MIVRGGKLLGAGRRGNLGPVASTELNLAPATKLLQRRKNSRRPGRQRHYRQSQGGA